MGAQGIVSFGFRNGSQSRELDNGSRSLFGDYSAKSECYGAFEQRRKTSTKDFKADIMKEIGEIGEMHERLDQKKVEDDANDQVDEVDDNGRG